MRRHVLPLLLCAACLVSCKKKSDPTPAPTPDQSGPIPTNTASGPEPTRQTGRAQPQPTLYGLLRFWDSAHKEHVYTYGDGEPAAWRTQPVFSQEKVIGYASITPQPDAVRLYRAYRRNARHSFYLTKPAGLTDIERIEAFELYVWTKPGKGRVAVHASFSARDEDAFFDTDLETVRGYRPAGQKRKVVEAMFYLAEPSNSESPIAMAGSDSVPVVKQPRARLVGHYAQVTAVAAAHHGQMIVSGSWDGTIRVWDLASLKEQATFIGDEGMVHRIAVTPDDKAVAVAGSSGVRVWNLADRIERRLRGPGKDVYALGFGAGGHTLTAGSAVQVSDGQRSRLDGRLYTWDLTADKPPTVSPTRVGVPMALAYTAGGKSVAVIEGGEVTVYDPGTGKPVTGFKADVRGVSAIAASPDGATLAVGSSNGSIRLLDATTGRELAVLPNSPGPIGQLAFSPDGALLATVPAEQGRNTNPPFGEVRVWDVVARRMKAILTGSATAVAFGPGPDTVLTGGRDGTVSIWQLPNTGKIPSPTVPPMAGTQLATLPKMAGKVQLQWRPVAGTDGTWTAVLPGKADISHIELPATGDLVSDIYNVAGRDGVLLVCQVRVDTFPRSPTRDEFETDNLRSLNLLGPQVGFDLKDVTATTTTVAGQYARRYEVKSRQFGPVHFLRVLAINQTRTRIFSFLTYGPDISPEIRQTFFESFRLHDASSPPK